MKGLIFVLLIVGCNDPAPLETVDARTDPEGMWCWDRQGAVERYWDSRTVTNDAGEVGHVCFAEDAPR